MRIMDANPAQARHAALPLLMVLAGSALLALSAQITVPMFPVPMTLQTLAVSVIGLTYGARLGALTVLAYLAEGAMGLPVFAGGTGSAAVLFGPTGGFLWGFVGMAWLTGALAARVRGRGVLALLASVLVPALLVYVPGTLMLMAVTGLDLGAALALAAAPFVLGDVIKSVVAAMSVAGIRGLRKRG